VSGTGHSRRTGEADDNTSRRRNATFQPQGEALIIELQAAKIAIERERQSRRRGQKPLKKTQGVRPAHTLRFASPAERLDRFDLRSLQNPTRVADVDQGIAPDRNALPIWAPPSAIRVFLQTLKVLLHWLLAAGVDGDAHGDFTEQVVRRHEVELKAASRVLVVGAAVAGIWAVVVPMSGAVVLPGTLVVESSVKKIQHPTGGVVAEIPVQDGMHVNAGTLLARLDQTQVQASQLLIANQLDQTRARIARLVGERDGLKEIQPPEPLARRMGEPAVAQLMTSETSLFNARSGSRQSQKDLYESNIRQLEDQIGGLEAEIKSKSSQLNLIASELVGVQELFAKGLVPLTRMTTLQRDAARLDGERAQLTATIAETKAKIGQAQLQIVKIDQDFRSEVMKDLRESQDKEAELTEKHVAAKDQLDRIDIRAPTSGIVHQLAVHTIGGVVRPGDVIMEIVPDNDNLEIEGHLPPNEIDQVKRGQRAYLRFSAFDRQTTPQVAGILSYVSADLSHDAQTNASFYVVRIDLLGDERRRLNGLTLVSGMPVEVFLETGSRTMVSYLFKPITDQFRRMFNER
jgi:membrane fusion protein, type I secretion system